MLLEVKDLVKHFPITRGFLARTAGFVRAVDGVSFTLEKDAVLGLVGESGCGKTTAGRCILRLIEPTSGSVLVNGEDVLAMKGTALKKLRRNLQVVFQDPMSSLNPRMTVRDIVAEPLIIHHMAKGRELDKRAAMLLDEVGLPRTALSRYPHEFSGGQRQRVGIARALALRPKLIIADEPVSALDVSVQAQIINLLMDLKKEHELSYLFIAHNLAVVRHISDRIAVMYLGKIVEEGPADAVCETPLHPYTRALLAAVPVPDVSAAPKHPTLHGDVPSPANPPPGCAFHTRCPLVRPECREQVPEFVEKGTGRRVRCPWV
ncbi:MAG: ABC transporter ATP-binding protein [Fibrobacterota bacterium]